MSAPAEQLREDVIVNVRRSCVASGAFPSSALWFLDESGSRPSCIARTHGSQRRRTRGAAPDQSGHELTVLGAIRLSGWVQTSTMFATMNAERFVAWLGASFFQPQ